jgi:hypothetical protein
MTDRRPSGSDTIDEGALDRARTFALAEAEAARGLSDWTDAQSTLARLAEAPAEVRDARREACRDAFEAYQDSIARLAQVPAPGARALAYKVEAIGRIWLGAEGVWYEALRAGVARDADRLAVPVPAAPRARRR